VRPSLFDHRLAVAIVAIAVCATAGIFLFARPEYRPPGSSLKAVPIPSYVTPAASGWTWPRGLPGFRVGDDMRSSNVYGVTWATLSGLRIAARPAHVDPQSLRVLGAARLAPHEPPFLLVSGRDAHGRTCIGAQPGPSAPRFFCPAQLAGRVAVVNVGVEPSYNGRWPIYVDGVVSAAVTRVTVTTAGMLESDVSVGKRVVHVAGAQVVYLRSARSWGTVESYVAGPRPWSARVDVYGAHGKLATLPLRFTHPGAYVFVR
jgi:hypothetical protein